MGLLKGLCPERGIKGIPWQSRLFGETLLFPDRASQKFAATPPNSLDKVYALSGLEQASSYGWETTSGLMRRGAECRVALLTYSIMLG